MIHPENILRGDYITLYESAVAKPEFDFDYESYQRFHHAAQLVESLKGVPLCVKAVEFPFIVVTVPANAPADRFHMGEPTNKNIALDMRNVRVRIVSKKYAKAFETVDPTLSQQLKNAQHSASHWYQKYRELLQQAESL